MGVVIFYSEGKYISSTQCFLSNGANEGRDKKKKNALNVKTFIANFSLLCVKTCHLITEPTRKNLIFFLFN